LPDVGAQAGARAEEYQPSSDKNKAERESVAVLWQHDMTSRIEVKAS